MRGHSLGEPLLKGLRHNLQFDCDQNIRNKIRKLLIQEKLLLKNIQCFQK